MPTRDITILTDVALITCIVQRGLADGVVAAARQAGAQGATVHFGRGYGVRERLGLLGITVDAEKEVISVVVATDQADLVFESMYLAGRLDTPGMGFMYLTHLEKAATHIPAEVVALLSRRRAGAE